MPERVYIETTVPSFYYNTREDQENQVMEHWTRRWWDRHRQSYDLCVSVVVIDELTSGNHPRKQEKLALLEGIPVFLRTPIVDEVAREYIRSLTMPSDPVADALHLAIASVQKCDLLLTWNCSHLANHNKMKQVAQMNRRLGLATPLIMTPFQLLAERKDEF